MCKVCLDRRVGNGSSAAVDEPPEESDVLASMLSEVEESKKKGCPKCGNAMSDSAMLCTRCGFNRATGGRVTTLVGEETVEEKVEKSAPNEYDLKRAAAKRDLASRPARVVVCTLIGAGVGTAIWATLVYSLKTDRALFALIVGGCTGAGTAAGAAGYAGRMTGMWAAGVTVLALLLGRYAVINQLVDDEVHKIKQAVQGAPVTPFDGQLLIAEDVIDEYLSKGLRVTWPYGKSLQNAARMEDLPRTVATETRKRWDALPPAEQQGLLAQVQAQRDALLRDLELIAEEAKEKAKEGSTWMMLRYFLAIGLAFALGSGFKVIE
ncbi:MAG: zinc ribbon domain-containing protein [Phycisphaeraceae bacterium]|nr:zinc ribbon domain-containing protein [Phycisphaeraceae bacterium]